MEHAYHGEDGHPIQVVVHADDAQVAIELFYAAVRLLPPNPFRRPRLMVVFIGSIGVIIMGALTAPKIIQRFQSAPIQSEQTREYFNQAAHAMANNHMFGVGLNAYAWVLANTDYYW